MSKQPATPIHPLVLMQVEARLTTEQKAIQNVVRDFAAKELRPNIANWYEAGELPARDIAKALGGIGLLGMHLKNYGCAGTDAMSYGLACLELEAVDSGLRSLVSVQGSLAMFAIYKFGSEEQKQEWLPKLAKGDAIGCFGLTEADHGSNPSGMTTYAKRSGSDWVINGSKMWITNGGVADVAIIWAQTDEGIRGFCVPTKTAGLVVNPIKHKLSARDCFEVSLGYATTREQFDGPISKHQLTQGKFADMATKITTSMLLAYHLADLKDQGKIEPEQISMGKFHNVNASLEIARSARSILGGAGITSEYSVFRHMSNLETVLTYEGTHEIHMLVLGQALTGIAAFR